MTYTIEKTENEILLRFPLAKNDVSVRNALDHLLYLSTKPKRSVSQAEINELAKEAKAGWWNENKERFRGQPGFEWMEEE